MLDNFEHVLPAAPVIARSARAAPGLGSGNQSRSLLAPCPGSTTCPSPGWGLDLGCIEREGKALRAKRCSSSPSGRKRSRRASRSPRKQPLIICPLPAPGRTAAGPSSSRQPASGETPRGRMLDRLSQSGALQVLGHGLPRRRATGSRRCARPSPGATPALGGGALLFHALGIFTSGTTWKGQRRWPGLSQDAAPGSSSPRSPDKEHPSAGAEPQHRGSLRDAPDPAGICPLGASGRRGAP